jgi:hypothetical protein
MNPWLCGDHVDRGQYDSLYRRPLILRPILHSERVYRRRRHKEGDTTAQPPAHHVDKCFSSPEGTIHPCRRIRQCSKPAFECYHCERRPSDCFGSERLGFLPVSGSIQPLAAAAARRRNFVEISTTCSSQSPCPPNDCQQPVVACQWNPKLQPKQCYTRDQYGCFGVVKGVDCQYL